MKFEGFKDVFDLNKSYRISKKGLLELDRTKISICRILARRQAEIFFDPERVYCGNPLKIYREPTESPAMEGH